MPIVQVQTGTDSYSQFYEGKMWEVRKNTVPPPGTPARVIEKAKAAGVKVLEPGQDAEKPVVMAVTKDKGEPSVVVASSTKKRLKDQAKQQKKDAAAKASKKVAPTASGKPYDSNTQ
jgi:hypothetical protein